MYSHLLPFLTKQTGSPVGVAHTTYRETRILEVRCKNIPLYSSPALKGLEDSCRLLFLPFHPPSFCQPGSIITAVAVWHLEGLTCRGFGLHLQIFSFFLRQLHPSLHFPLVVGIGFSSDDLHRQGQMAVVVDPVKRGGFDQCALLGGFKPQVPSAGPSASAGACWPYSRHQLASR